jgi:cobalt-zinc-cadmium efflux system protein
MTHGTHSHSHPHHGDEARLLLAMALTGGFMLAEVAGGIVSGSLALLADAGHMLTDTGSLALAWLAMRMSRRPADARRSYGYHRLQILAAYTNGLTLLFIAAWVVVEAIRRLLDPAPVLGGLMLVVAVGGLLVNLAAFAVLHTGPQQGGLNVRAAALHVMGDLLGSVAAITAAGVILATGWHAADPLLSLVVAVLITRSAVLILRESGHILLEGSPAGFDAEALRDTLHAAVPEVVDVHHVHAWLLTAERPLVTLHVRVDGGDPDTLARVHAALHDACGIDHATVQLEPALCPDEVHAGASSQA